MKPADESQENTRKSQKISNFLCANIDEKLKKADPTG